MITALFFPQHSYRSEKSEEIHLTPHVDRDESPRMHFFQRRELSAFFVSMAGARLRSNEFFSAGRKRTKINLNLVDGNLLTYHERGYSPSYSLSFSRAFAPRPRKPGRRGRSLISSRRPFYRRDP